jgi:hypothetical protein
MSTYAELFARYRAKHGKLVEPKQGFHSLHQELWLAYSIGRAHGFLDLGTYNPNSLLPGGGKSDHAYLPAYAFDLGRNNRFFNKGWNYLVARRMARFYVREHQALNINYVILGDHIWSREKPYWHYYGPDRSHFFHIHVSGVHAA